MSPYASWPTIWRNSTMPQSALHLIERFDEHLEKDAIPSVPQQTRGIYVLYSRRGKRVDVVYVGMAAAGNRSGIQSRLRKHKRRKGDLWTHFSIFKVWDNVRDEQIIELEGLLRHIYRLDTNACKLNVQRRFKTIHEVWEPLPTWPKPKPRYKSKRLTRR